MARAQLNALVFLAVLLHSSWATDYCTICRNNIGCNNDGSFGAACSPDRNLVTITSDLKNLILDLHNKLRSDTATGKINGFLPANRMAFVEWDGELANLAVLNAKRCIFAHDQCHATDNFPWSGQNIAISGVSNGYPITNTTVQTMINSWFNEYKDTDMSVIRKYRTPTNNKQNGHFTAMVNEKQTRIGCGTIQYKSGRFFSLYLVCNYAITNILDYPVYNSGPACSACTTGCHPVYPGLCSAKENIVARP